MNETIEKFLAEARERKRQEEQNAKAEHLISLGLIDESSIQWHKKQKRGAKYHAGLDKWYTGTAIPIEVSDEAYQAICEFYPREKEEQDPKALKAEYKLQAWAKAILVIGIIFGILSIYFGFRLTMDISTEGAGLACLGGGIALLFYALIISRILQTFANISIRLHNIEKKTEK